MVFLIHSDANVWEELCKLEKERTWEVCDSFVMLFCRYLTIPSYLLLPTRRVIFTLRLQWPYKGLLPVNSMSTVRIDSGRTFFSIPIPYFPPSQFNHENGRSMLYRNSGMYMQNYMMSHGQLSIVTTLRAGRSGVRILAGPRYSTPRAVVGHTDPPMISWLFPMGDSAGAWIWRFHRAQLLRISGAIPLLPLYAFHVTTRMSNAGNRVLEIRILNPDLDLRVEMLASNYRSVKRYIKFKSIDLLYG